MADSHPHRGSRAAREDWASRGLTGVDVMEGWSMRTRISHKPLAFAYQLIKEDPVFWLVKVPTEAWAFVCDLAEILAR